MTHSDTLMALISLPSRMATAYVTSFTRAWPQAVERHSGAQTLPVPVGNTTLPALAEPATDMARPFPGQPAF